MAWHEYCSNLFEFYDNTEEIHMKIPLIFALGLMACATSALSQTSPYVAGLQPDRRPDEAPQITVDTRTPEQVEQALHGVEKPVPGNVELVAATGNWWVPLRQPGLNNPYDLRGWHGNSASAATADASASALSTAAPPAR